MKKSVFAFLVILLTVFVAVSCGEKDNEVNSDTTVNTTDNKITLTKSDNTVISDDELHGWLAYGGNLTVRDKFTVEERDSISISMAKNEMEGFQYVMASTKNYDGLRCEVPALSDGKGNTLEGIVYVAWNIFVNNPAPGWKRDFTPSALLEQDDPYQGGSFDIVAGRSKTIYILFKTDEDTVPGTYEGKLEICQGNEILKTHDISVNVWDIYYEEKTECLTSIGYGFSWDWWEPEAPDSAPDMLKEPIDLLYKYVDFLLSYRLSPSILPGNGSPVLCERAAEYLNNPRMNFTNYLFAYLYDLRNSNRLEELAEQYEIAKKNGWLDKINLCLGDEPAEIDAIDNDIAMGRLCQQYYQTTWFGVPTYMDLPKDGKNLIERYSEITTLHIPKKSLLADNDLLESCKKLKRERGDTLMWYTCGDEAWNMNDFLPCESGTVQRIIFWQQYQNDFDGYLIWQTNMWENYPDIWADDYEETKPVSPLSKDAKSDGNGCAILWNPVTKLPVPTFCAEAMRDGVEDFQLMRMAEKVLGKDTVMSYVEKITTSITEYTTDAELLANVRNELAEALMLASVS